jgi:acetyl esterase/lipase
MRRGFAFVAVLLAATIVGADVGADVGAGAVRAAPNGQRKVFTTKLDIVYRTIDGQRLRIDAFLPATTAKKRPAVLFIHGGGWTGGDKISIEDEARWAARLGFVAFSVEYRLTPAYPYPAAVDDVRAAVRWLRAPEQVATFRIDPGHLSAMLATIGHGAQTRGSRVRVAVSWSGPLDLTRESATYSAVKFTPTVAGFLACAYDEPGCAATERAASPISYVDPSDAPILLVNSEDELIPADQATVMADALDAAGVPNRLVILPGDAHAQSYRDTQWDDAVLYLERHLGKPVAPAA